MINLNKGDICMITIDRLKQSLSRLNENIPDVNETLIKSAIISISQINENIKQYNKYSNPGFFTRLFSNDIELKAYRIVYSNKINKSVDGLKVKIAEVISLNSKIETFIKAVRDVKSEIEFSTDPEYQKYTMQTLTLMQNYEAILANNEQFILGANALIDNASKIEV